MCIYSFMDTCNMVYLILYVLIILKIQLTSSACASINLRVVKIWFIFYAFDLVCKCVGIMEGKEWQNFSWTRTFSYATFEGY